MTLTIMSSKAPESWLNLAIQMDVEGPDNILQEENAYFDATHTRFMASNPWDYGCFIQL